MIINQFMVHSSFATQKPARQKSTIAMKLISCVPAVTRDTRFVPRTPPPAPAVLQLLTAAGSVCRCH